MRSLMYYKNRKDRRERLLRKLANARAAKARKNLECPPEREPKMVRSFPLEWGLRDKATGEFSWTDFKSIRAVIRALRIVRRYYVPGVRPPSSVLRLPSA